VYQKRRKGRWTANRANAEVTLDAPGRIRAIAPTTPDEGVKLLAEREEGFQFVSPRSLGDMTRKPEDTGARRMTLLVGERCS
jgi:hypothetical protein